MNELDKWRRRKPTERERETKRERVQIFQQLNHHVDVTRDCDMIKNNATRQYKRMQDII